MLSKLIRYLPIIIAVFKLLSKMFGKRANASTTAESQLPPMDRKNTGGGLGDLWDKISHNGNNASSPAETSRGLDPIAGYEDTHSKRGRDSSGGIATLYRNRTSDAIVTDQGEVVHVLPDDTEGDRHQKFIVAINDNLTILIAHNIDMAERVTVRKGDTVRFKGEYEWDERGGIMHWTHHDPKGWHENGWIEINGNRVS